MGRKSGEQPVSGSASGGSNRGGNVGGNANGTSGKLSSGDAAIAGDDVHDVNANDIQQPADASSSGTTRTGERPASVGNINGNGSDRRNPFGDGRANTREKQRAVNAVGENPVLEPTEKPAKLTDKQSNEAAETILAGFDLGVLFLLQIEEAQLSEAEKAKILPPLARTLKRMSPKASKQLQKYSDPFQLAMALSFWALRVMPLILEKNNERLQDVHANNSGAAVPVPVHTPSHSPNGNFSFEPKA